MTALKFFSAGIAGIAIALSVADSGCKLGGVDVPAFSTQILDASRFKALHAAAAPAGEGERWTEIPWMTDLTEARRAAAREGKPLFMWIMDGHPLGCT